MTKFISHFEDKKNCIVNVVVLSAGNEKKFYVSEGMTRCQVI